LTYLIEYLGEFEFIFETVLGFVSGTRWVILKQKNGVENLTLGHLLVKAPYRGLSKVLVLGSMRPMLARLEI
jgi:hypothetical protein